MWLSEHLRAPARGESAESGTVTLEETATAVFARGETRALTVLAPGGYAWRPRGGESVLILKGGDYEERAYLLGAAEAAPDDLRPGEVRLHSGGASLTLRRDGRVELTGEVYINGEKYERPEEAEHGA